MLQRDLLHPTVIGTALRKAHALIANPAKIATSAVGNFRIAWPGSTMNSAGSRPHSPKGEALGPIIEAIKARELERGRLREELAHLDAPSVKPIDPQTLRTVLRDRLVDWLEGLHRPPAEARHALRPLLQERLVFTPRETRRGRYYEITGTQTVTPVLAGIVDTKAWCPRRD
jgi:hypothetical protein